MKKNIVLTVITLLIISSFLITHVQKNNNLNNPTASLELDCLYEGNDYDFLFRYPSQWTIVEDPWHPATETTEADPEKTVNLLLYETEETITAYPGKERIVFFDSQSHHGGLFRLVSGEENDIVNALDIPGTMITEPLEIKGQTWIQVLVYYEDGYSEGIGMGGSYGACAIVKEETYEQYETLIIEILKSVHMKQS